MRITDTHTFFNEKEVFSNWHKSNFSYHGIEFNCAQQFMVYAKAKTFKDEETAEKILASSDPAEQKELGRNIKGYDEAVWADKREHVVYVANREKYKQNPDMLRKLLATEGAQLVAALRQDTLWGIGMGENDPGVDSPKNWKGENKFGKLLTKLRQDFVVYLQDNPEKEKKYLAGQIDKPPAAQTNKSRMAVSA